MLVKILNSVLVSLWLTANAAAVYYASRTLTLQDRGHSPLDQPPPLLELPTHIIPAVTLGHPELYRDYLYLWTVQFLADPQLLKEDPLKVHTFIMQILRHRPAFESIYTLSCATFGMIYRIPALCEPITLAGMDALPQSWRIPTMQAVFYSMYAQDVAKAAAFFLMASTKEGSPEYVKGAGERLLQQHLLSVEELDAILERSFGGTGLRLNIREPPAEPATESEHETK